MSDLVLLTATRAQLQTQELSTRLIAVVRRASERLGREQTGQDMVEYAGVLFVVALIIFGVVSSGIDNDIKNGIKGLVGNILGGTSPKGGGAGAGAAGG